MHYAEGWVTGFSIGAIGSICVAPFLFIYFLKLSNKTLTCSPIFTLSLNHSKTVLFNQSLIPSVDPKKKKKKAL